jgi:uncharacterized protein involved in response to NO
MTPPRISFFAFGPRPADIFLVAGSAWSAVVVAISVGAMSGVIPSAARYGSPAWHAHELIFGATGAVIAGFALSAIPNWVGRPPVAGARLTALVALWVAGRMAILAAEEAGPFAAAIVDSLFPVALALTLLHEIRAGAGRRSAKVAVLISAFALADVGFHIGAIQWRSPEFSARAGIAVIVALVMVIGGRIIPAFTADRLAEAQVADRPAPYGRFDTASLTVAALALALWIGRPESPLTAALLLVAGTTQGIRLLRWKGWTILGAPLVLVLHVGYAFVPAGFLLLGTAILWPRLPVSAVHAWTTGAMGLMMLGVMARAGLGHSGRPILAGPGLSAIFLAGFAAAAMRVAAPLGGWFSTALLMVCCDMLGRSVRRYRGVAGTRQLPLSRPFRSREGRISVDELTLARALHVIAVVHWIGGGGDGDHRYSPRCHAPCRA